MLLALSLAHAQDNPVSTRIESYVVSLVTGDGGEEEEFVESQTARPGQVVEYRVFVVNDGDTTLPPRAVVVTGPVPEGTSFLEGSATPSSEEVLTEFSADGQDFSEPPVLAASGGERSAVDPEDYAAVRWTLLQPLAPGAEETFAYRVTVE